MFLWNGEIRRVNNRRDHDATVQTCLFFGFQQIHGLASYCTGKTTEIADKISEIDMALL